MYVYLNINASNSQLIQIIIIYADGCFAVTSNIAIFENIKIYKPKILI